MKVKAALTGTYRASDAPVRLSVDLGALRDRSFVPLLGAGTVLDGEREAIASFRVARERLWTEGLIPLMRSTRASAVTGRRQVRPRVAARARARASATLKAAVSSALIERSRALSAAHDAVVRAFADMARLEDRARLLCVEAVEQMDYRLAAYQHIDWECRRIETVAGEGEALKWVGVANHPIDLDPSENHPRDIQAFVAITKCGLVVRGDHPLVDRDLFLMFGHENALRAFLPVVVLRNRKTGEVTACFEWRIDQNADGIEIRPVAPAGFVTEVIGTLEVGYLDGRDMVITPEQLQRTCGLISGHAKSLYDTTLKAALERAVREVMLFCGAESASTHLFADPREAPQQYTFNVVVGRACSMATLAAGGGGISAPPRRTGLGARAVRMGEPCCIPDAGAGHGRRDELKYSNPIIWKRHGVRAMAAFPLKVQRSPNGGGVVYVHYFRQRFLDRTLFESAQSLVNRIGEEVRVARERRENRERWRQVHGLLNLMCSSLVDDNRCMSLREVARNVRTVLSADLVCVIPFVEGTWSPPTVAGWTKQASPSDLFDGLGPLIVSEDVDGEGRSAPDVGEGTWLAGVPRPDGTTIQSREGIRSAAALTLRGRGGELRGVMYVGFRTFHSLEDGEVSVIRIVGRLASALIEGEPPRFERDDIEKTLPERFNLNVFGSPGRAHGPLAAEA